MAHETLKNIGISVIPFGALFADVFKYGISNLGQQRKHKGYPA